MATPKNAKELRISIQLLELRQKSEMALIKQEFEVIIENLKPVNLVKNTLDDIIDSKEIQANVFDLSLGAVSGMLAKKIVVGDSDNSVLNFTGNLVGNFISQKTIQERKTIHFIGKSILKFLVATKQKNKPQKQN
jgi:uncharacterized membrane protein YeaQ/YmgE (transglycosylase-associated protein family)